MPFLVPDGRDIKSQAIKGASMRTVQGKYTKKKWGKVVREHNDRITGAPHTRKPSEHDQNLSHLTLCLIHL